MRCTNMSATMDDNMLSCFAPLYIENGANMSSLQTLLSVTKNNKLFTLKKGSLKEVLSHVHTCVNSSKHRVEGLLILSSIIDQCDTEVFTENAVTWLKFMLQILQSHNPVPVKRLTCYVFCQLIDSSSVFTVLSRDVTGIIPQLFPLLLEASSEWRSEALMVINSCIQNYRGVCGPFKNKVEVFVVSELGQASVSKEAVRCYTLLAGCGGGGNLGTKYTENWTTQYQKVIDSLHFTLDQLYEGLDEDEEIQRFHQQTLFLDDLPESYSEKISICVMRMKTLVQCLESMISEMCPAVIHVPVEEILHFICRVCLVNCKKLKSIPSTERMLLSGYVPAIHLSAVQLLSSLIKRFRKLMLPQTKQVLSVLVQELMWTHQDYIFGQDKPYSTLRSEVYCCLNTWFQSNKCLIEVTREEENLLEELLHDCKPQIDTLKIETNVSKPSERLEPPPSKKKKKGGYQEISHGISSQRKINHTADSVLTASALNVLYWLVLCIGPHLKQETYQRISDFVIMTNLKVQQHHPDIPYSDGRCRLALLKVLQACCLVPHPHAPSPLQCAINIFRIAAQDSYSEVSCFCIEAQRLCEALIHPRAPCFIKPKIIEEKSKNDIVPSASTVQLNSSVQQSKNIFRINVRDSENSELSDSGDINTELTETCEIVKVHEKTNNEISLLTEDIVKTKKATCAKNRPSNDKSTKPDNVELSSDVDEGQGHTVDDKSSEENIQQNTGSVVVVSDKHIDKDTDKHINKGVDKDLSTFDNVPEKIELSENLSESENMSDDQPVPSAAKISDRLKDEGSPLQMDENSNSENMECDSTQQDKSEEVDTMLMAFMDVDPE